MMRLLLLGAGFSRNWGGWVASEVMGELCGRLIDRPHLVEMLQVTTNFEEAFGQRQNHAAERDNEQARTDVALMERAIIDTFREMNMAFALQPRFEFSQRAERSIQKYLSQFDAIFTLNQDLLLELNYDGMELLNSRDWDGYCFPGIAFTNDWRNASKQERGDMTLNVGNEARVERRIQPIFKLHGSVNWRTADGDHVLVIGTGKEDVIRGSELLKSYQLLFRQYLFSGDAQVMVIGYGFSDKHINDLMIEAAREAGLKMFLVNPAGLDAFYGHKASTPQGRNELTQIPLVGLSMRPLAMTFGDDDDPSFGSFQRFLGA